MRLPLYCGLETSSSRRNSIKALESTEQVSFASMLYFQQPVPVLECKP